MTGTLGHIPFSIDSDLNLITWDGSGLVINTEMFIRTIELISTNPLYRPTQNIIHDYTRIRELDVTYAGLDHIIAADAGSNAHVGKVAIVIGTNRGNHLLAKLYAKKAPKQLNYMPRIFITREEAEAWIFDDEPDRQAATG